MSQFADPAVEAILRWNRAKHRGTPMRAVAEAAQGLGYQVLPPKKGSTAKYLRLVVDGPTGASVTVYLHSNKLTSISKGDRVFATAIPGGTVTDRDVQFPFSAVDPAALLERFHAHVGGTTRTVAPASVPFGPSSTTAAPQRPVGAPTTGPSPAGPPRAVGQSASGVDGPPRRGGPRRLVIGCTAVLALVLVVAGALGSGPGGGLLMAGLVVGLVGLAAVVMGRSRWAFIASRPIGGIVAGIGVAALIAGAATMPAPKPTATHTFSTSSSASASTSRPARATPNEAAIAAAEASLAAATGPTGGSNNVSSMALLADPAAAAAVTGADRSSALAALAAVPIKGRAPLTGYTRDQFGHGWIDTDHNGCDTRNDILGRDLTQETFKAGTHNCVLLTGVLADPYSERTIDFQRGQTTSEAVQIDHVVALADAWQTGAQGWDETNRVQFANDPRNLLAVDGSLNEQKGDGDAATWLPPNTPYRCEYVARQVAVKVAYGLWMTQAEWDASATILSYCATQPLPDGVVANLPQPAPVTSSPAPAPVVVPAPVPVPRPAPAPAPAPRPVPPPAPAPAPAPPPAPVGAPPAGVYKAGQFCKVAYEGMTTTATNGQQIKCVDIDNDGHPHWIYA